MNVPVTLSPIETLYATSGSEKHRESNADAKIVARELFSSILNGSSLSQVAYAGLSQEFNLALSLRNDNYTANQSKVRVEDQNSHTRNVNKSNTVEKSSAGEDDRSSQDLIDDGALTVTDPLRVTPSLTVTDDRPMQAELAHAGPPRNDKQVAEHGSETVNIVGPIAQFGAERPSNVNTAPEANNSVKTTRTLQNTQQQGLEPAQSAKMQDANSDAVTRPANPNANAQLKAKVTTAPDELASQPSANLAASTVITAQGNQNSRLGGEATRLPAADLAGDGVESNPNGLVSRQGGKPGTSGHVSRQDGKPGTNGHQNSRFGSELTQLAASNLAGDGVEPNSNSLVSGKGSKPGINGHQHGRLGAEVTRLPADDFTSEGIASNSNTFVSRQDGKSGANGQKHGNTFNKGANQGKPDAQGALTGGQQAAQQAVASATERNNLFAATLARANTSLSQQIAQPLGGDTSFSAVNNGQQQTQRAADMPQPQRAKPQLPPRFVSDQISVQVQRAIGNGADRINIQLKPAELGRIEVKLEVAHDGKFNAVIAAERSDTLDLLKQDAKSLQQSLQQAGLNADSSSLSFTLQQHAKSFEQALGNEGNRRAGSEEDQGLEDDADQQVTGARNIITDDVIDVEV